jgi:uncharacterized protein (DUF1778 family)
MNNYGSRYNVREPQGTPKYPPQYPIDTSIFGPSSDLKRTLNQIEIREIDNRIRTAQRMLIEMQQAYPGTEVSNESFDIQTILAEARGIILQQEAGGATMHMSRLSQRFGQSRY